MPGFSIAPLMVNGTVGLEGVEVMDDILVSVGFDIRSLGAPAHVADDAIVGCEQEKSEVG